MYRKGSCIMSESYDRRDSDGKTARILAPLLVVIVVVLGIWSGYTYLRNLEYKNMLSLSYRRAVQEASMNLSNISADLVKGMYASTPPQMSQISSKLWKESSTAKAALGSLPLAEMHLDNASRFLSQVGDYAMYLSRKVANKEMLTHEERQNFQHLREYADRLSDQIRLLDQQLESGEISFRDIERAVMSNKNGADAGAEEQSQGKLTPIFTNTSLDAMEGGFTGYPSLVYDGPFSDHILNRTSAMVKAANPITEEEARVKAREAVGVDADIHNVRLEESNLPCYVFYSDDFSVAVTKNGGYLCYVVRPQPGAVSTVISPEEAVASAENYLKALGISSMEETYYEIHDGIMTVNFAYEEGGVICYTDLIKIDVSMENGQIMAYDARGYLMNHKTRALPEPRITESEARRSLSDTLDVENSRLALIPTTGQNEVLAYEFTATGSGGDHVLTYINAQTGAEEQILLLIENENGVLTK